MNSTDENVWHDAPMQSLLAMHLAELSSPKRSKAIASETNRIEFFRVNSPSKGLFATAPSHAAKPRGFWPSCRDWLAHKQFWLGAGSIGLAATAAISLMFIQPEPPDIAIKGQTRAFIIVERQGEKHSWDSIDQLLTGDRIGAELLSAEDAIGLLAIYDRNGRALSTPKDVAQNLLVVKAGERKHFSRGFELIDPSDGESLVIIACSAAVFSSVATDPANFIEKYAANLSRIGESNFPKSCWYKSTQLRN